MQQLQKRQFQFSVPNKGDCNLRNWRKCCRSWRVSILSPQQRGLQSNFLIIIIISSLFQFSVPNKGDCNTAKCSRCRWYWGFNSQSPTKGTAIWYLEIKSSVRICFNSQSPTKGTAINYTYFLILGGGSFNSQSPTKGTAITSAA